MWTDDIQELVGGRGQIHVKASKGIHLVVPKDRVHSSTGIILRTEKSVLFVIPWGRHWIIGTTDTAWDLDRAHPAASKADIDYVLDHVNSVLTTPLSHDDVEGVYAGLRPLLTGETEETSKLSREHVVAHPVPGLVLVAAASTRRTASWPRTPSTPSPTASTARSPSRAPTGSRSSAATASRPCGTPATASRPAPACTWPASSTSCAATAPCWTTCSN